MSKAYEMIKGKHFHDTEDVQKFLDEHGIEWLGITSQYISLKEEDRIITMMFGGSVENFFVAYEF